MNLEDMLLLTLLLMICGRSYSAKEPCLCNEQKQSSSTTKKVHFETEHTHRAGQRHSTSLSTEDMEKILTGYDKRVRAGVEDDDPLRVEIEIFVISVYGIDERKNEFTMEFYLRQYWKDSRLAMSKYNITNHVFLPLGFARNIWLPTTYFLMSKRAVEHKVTTDNVLVRVDKDGNIFFSQRLSVTTTCILDLRLFPHDTQTCNLTVESYSYQTTDCVYFWGTRASEGVEYGSKDYLDLPEFTLDSVKTKIKINEYSIGNHSSLVAIFTFKRRIGYFLIETWLPSSIVVAISWVSFWISPHAAPARVALGITTILTMVTISSGARQSLPKVSYVKALDWFLLACLLFVFGSLLEYAVIQYRLNVPKKNNRDETESVASMNTDEVPLGSLGKNKDDNCFARCIHCTFRLENEAAKYETFNTRKARSRTFSPKHTPPIVTLPGQRGTMTVHNEVDVLSRKLFPLCYIAFNVVYLTCMLYMYTSIKEV